MRTVETKPVVDPTPRYPEHERDTLYTKILVAVDGSKQGERILPHVAALAGYTQAAVVLLHVNREGAGETHLADSMPLPPEMQARGAIAAADPPAPLPPEVVEGMAESERYLSGLVEQLEARGVRALKEQIVGEPAEVIVARARELGADLIAMTGSSHTGLGRLFSDNVAEAVVRSAPVPVLMVSGHDE